jgi:peptidoglycan hydrolase-like protein with peptidoglycan-binding domain
MTDTPERLTKRLTAARLAGVPELEAAFADVSGQSDISDGEGVRPPSEGRPVQLLQESLLAMGYDMPGGADGLYGPATQAAVLRFQIDAGHPWPPGQAWEHIGGISGSNTLAHFDMFDPGGTVSSHTNVPSGISATAVTFRESEDNPFMGFDTSTSPPSLVVGTSTRRRVRVDREPAESDVSFEPADASIVTVGLTHEGIVIGGERAGTTTVRASAGGRELSALLVNVKEAREVVVDFLFVAGSERDHEKATLLTLRLNRLWRRQANVHWTLGRVEDVAKASGAVPGRFTVFCVRDAEGFESDDPSIVFLPDADCPDGMDLVRAAALYLGASGDTPSGLMAACGSGEERRRISKALADAVNPSGT